MKYEKLYSDINFDEFVRIKILLAHCANNSKAPLMMMMNEVKINLCFI